MDDTNTYNALQAAGHLLEEVNLAAYDCTSIVGKILHTTKVSRLKITDFYSLTQHERAMMFYILAEFLKTDPNGL